MLAKRLGKPIHRMGSVGMGCVLPPRHCSMQGAQQGGGPAVRKWWHLFTQPVFKINSFAAVILATTAVAHQSQLAGFLAVVGLFSALGFAGE